MGASWKGQLRTKTQWYDGNGDEATQQVLGPAELPSSWEGDWRRTMMTGGATQLYNPGDGVQAVRAPFTLVQAVEAIFRGGMLLRVTWSQLSDDGDPDKNGKIVREGRAVEWEFRYTRLQDIAWTIQWEWKSRGLQTAPPITDVRSATIENEAAALQAKIAALVEANKAAAEANNAPTALTLGQLERLASTPSRYVTAVARQMEALQSNVSQAVDVAKTLATQPVAVAQNAVNYARSSVSQANAIDDTLGQVPYELLTTRQSASAVLQAAARYAALRDDAQQVAIAGQNFAQRIQVARQTAALAGKLQAGLNGAPETVSEVYVCKAGDTPQLVSQRFYGSPDHAVDILRANDMAWHTPRFTPGRIVLIPAIPTASQGNGV
jgi:hypothetical protein